MTPEEIRNIIDEKGVRAAVRVIIRVYEDAVKTKQDPYSVFFMPFAVAAVHVARWELGLDKRGKKRFEPKRVSDPRFNRLVRGLIPPGASSDELIIIIAKSAADRMVDVISRDNAAAEEAALEAAEIEAAEQGRRELEERENALDEAVAAALG